MSKQPVVSVLIPTHNYARYLPEAIESVLCQDYGDYELIISDDASTDESPQLLRHYSSVDARIHATLQETNLGMVKNWNACLSLARGKYVKFLFGDDRLGPRDALRRQVEALESCPSAVLATSARVLIDEQSKRIGLWDDLDSEGLHDGLKIGRHCLLKTKNLIGEPTAVMIRTDKIKCGFDARYRQIVDLAFWMRLLEQGDLVYSKRPLCEFRWHEKQATRTNSRLGLGFAEYAMLFNDHLDVFLPKGERLDASEKRDLFSSLLHARQEAPSSKNAAAAAEKISRYFGKTQIAAYWLRYRIIRPYVNLRLSIHKRISARKLEWSFGDGWKVLPGKNITGRTLLRHPCLGGAERNNGS